MAKTSSPVCFHEESFLNLGDAVPAAPRMMRRAFAVRRSLHGLIVFTTTRPSAVRRDISHYPEVKG